MRKYKSILVIASLVILFVLAPVEQVVAAQGMSTVPKNNQVSGPLVYNYVERFKAKKVFQIEVENATGKVSYYSSNRNVIRVGKNSGRAYVYGTGRAVITVVADNGTAKSTVIVVPKKNQITKVVTSKYQTATITWKKDANVSGYQLQLSKREDFSTEITQYTIATRLTNYRTTEALTKGDTYYMRVRGYKTISGKRYFGSFSETTKVVIK